MVFSDPIFLVLFLPISLIFFHATRIYANGTATIVVLVALSAIFYSYWSIVYLFLLVGQILVNYVIGKQLDKSRSPSILKLAVVGNLSLLGYFKYRNFFLGTLGDLVGHQFHLVSLIVPLGISFHTFQQIALLIDVKNQNTKLPPLLDYIIFVLFFPQLIAGPIVLHQEMGRQVAAIRSGAGRGLEWLAPGLLIFVFGLFKKVCLADCIAYYADAAFASKHVLMMPEAWVGAIDYTLQLFFDFSGYSDMAVGLGLMFGFKLPNNFLVPYASVSLGQFWQRWHITMFRFFMIYVYNPLWLSQRRRLKRWIKRPSLVLEMAFATSLPTLATFFLSGLWHGAGWTFIFFGLTHGFGMAIQQTWKSLRFRSPPKILGWALTMIVVLIGAVYFRSQSLGQANSIIREMFMAPSVPNWLATMLPFNVPVGEFALFPNAKTTVECLGLTILLGYFSLIVPVPAANPEALLPSRAKAFAMAGMTWLILEFIGQPRAFLYFAF